MKRVAAGAYFPTPRRFSLLNAQTMEPTIPNNRLFVKTGAENQRIIVD